MGDQSEMQARQSHMLMSEQRIEAHKAKAALKRRKSLPGVNKLAKHLVPFASLSVCLCLHHDGSWSVRKPSDCKDPDDVRFYSYCQTVTAFDRNARELLESLRFQIARSVDDE